MSVKKEPSGRRSVQVEVEVPGTPEEVWQAIASGPGVSSWFVPTKVEEDEHGKPVRVISDFGPGMESVAKVTAWEPPRRFAAESAGMGPDSPPMATEWIVEGRSGGVCVVRVVHSLFASTDDWDNQLENVESGWPGFFRILRLYLTHFRGRASAIIQVMGATTEPEAKAWQLLTRSLNLAAATVGQKCRAPAGVPPMAGIVERTSEGKHPHHLLLRLDEPIPGIASIGVFACGGPVLAAISLYLYGDRAAAVASRDARLWQDWLNELFSPAAKETA